MTAEQKPSIWVAAWRRTGQNYSAEQLGPLTAHSIDFLERIKISIGPSEVAERMSGLLDDQKMPRREKTVRISLLFGDAFVRGTLPAIPLLVPAAIDMCTSMLYRYTQSLREVIHERRQSKQIS